MHGSPTGFWAKLERDDDGKPVSWHPLIAHLADVAACARVILQETLLGERLAALADRPSLDPQTIDRLTVLTALHDLGKLNQGFQRRADPARRGCGHVSEAIAALKTPMICCRLAREIGLDHVATWGDAAEDLLIASICHHGRPVSPDEVMRADPSLWRAEGARDPFVEARHIADALRRWLPDAYAPNGPQLPGSRPFQHAFAGLVMLSDWLGSHTGYFPYAERSEPDRFPLASEWARAAVRRIGVGGGLARRALGDAEPTYARVLDPRFSPRPAQQAMSRLRNPPRSGSLVILEAETGAGKTEAAVFHYLRLLHAGAVDGMYFALPTRTAATQIQRRLTDLMARAFPDDDDARPPVVLAVPGYVVVDDQHGRLLPHFNVQWPDAASDRMRYRGWAAEHPKRALAGAVVVGTIDQALLSALAARHAHMRATALLRQLLVVDEVHASDAYMNRLLREVIAHQLDAGGHVLLMSATLGSSALPALLGPTRAPETPDLAEASARAYPAVSELREDRTLYHHPVASGGASKRVAIEIAPRADDPAAIASMALAHAREGARVLVIRNTVGDCVATHQALERLASDTDASDLLFRCRGVLTAHHSRFTRVDRGALDASIEEAFHPRRAGRPVVAIATQTVQQSLDLDADVMLTDLCPMDVLLQRVGRLQRHASRSRPTGYEAASVTVLVPAERDLGVYLDRATRPSGTHGLVWVYDDLRVIEATWRELESREHLTTPADCRALVERTTHRGCLHALAQELGDNWIAHGLERDGAMAADGSLAGVNIVGWDRPYQDGHAGELDRQVATRLGERDRLLRLPERMRGPFGLDTDVLRLPAWMCRTDEDEIEVDALVDRAPGSYEVHAAGQRYHYGRLGLEWLRDPPTQEDDE